MNYTKETQLKTFILSLEEKVNAKLQQNPIPLALNAHGELTKVVAKSLNSLVKQVEMEVENGEIKATIDAKEFTLFYYEYKLNEIKVAERDMKQIAGISIISKVPLPSDATMDEYLIEAQVKMHEEKIAQLEQEIAEGHTNKIAAKEKIKYYKNEEEIYGNRINDLTYIQNKQTLAVVNLKERKSTVASFITAMKAIIYDEFKETYFDSEEEAYNKVSKYFTRELKRFNLYDKGKIIRDIDDTYGVPLFKWVVVTSIAENRRDLKFNEVYLFTYNTFETYATTEQLPLDEFIYYAIQKYVARHDSNDHSLSM